MDEDKRRKLPAPVTTTEEFLLAVVLELRALTAAVEKLTEVLTPTEVELVADAGEWREVVDLVEAAPETPADEAAPKKSRKKVAE